jgi:hypothetical protein
MFHRCGIRQVHQVTLEAVFPYAAARNTPVEIGALKPTETPGENIFCHVFFGELKEGSGRIVMSK